MCALTRFSCLLLFALRRKPKTGSAGNKNGMILEGIGHELYQDEWVYRAGGMDYRVFVMGIECNLAQFQDIEDSRIWIKIH